MNLRTFINQAREAANLVIDSFNPTSRLPVLHTVADLVSDIIEGAVFALHSNKAADDLWDWTTKRNAEKRAREAADRLAEAEAEQEVWLEPGEADHVPTWASNPEPTPPWTITRDYAGTDAPWQPPRTEWFRTETTANTTPNNTNPKPFSAQTNDRLDTLITLNLQIRDTLTQISSAARAQPATGLEAAAAPAEDAPHPDISPLGAGQPADADDALAALVLAALLKKAGKQ